MIWVDTFSALISLYLLTWLYADDAHKQTQRVTVKWSSIITVRKVQVSCSSTRCHCRLIFIFQWIQILREKKKLRFSGTAAQLNFDLSCTLKQIQLTLCRIKTFRKWFNVGKYPLIQYLVFRSQSIMRWNHQDQYDVNNLAGKHIKLITCKHIKVSIFSLLNFAFVVTPLMLQCVRD